MYKVKKLLVSIALAAVLLAASITSAYATDKWTEHDSELLFAANAVTAVDWMQTKHISNNPQDHYEMNPILGSHPSNKKVDFYFAAVIVAENVIARNSNKKFRRQFLTTVVIVESLVVLHNVKIGIRF